MTRARLLLLGLTVLGAVVGMAWELGRREGERAGWAHRHRVIVESLYVTDTLYRRDTLRLRRLVTRWDTVRDSIDRWKHDTVVVERVVRVADSTIRACRQALATCETRVALQQRRAELAESLLARQAARDVRAERARMAAAGVTGVVIGLLVPRR
jgi:hypothetical protein